jgi:hypothetical protein
MNETSLDEKLKALEPAYQSEAERQIGRMLDRYGIPFFYRQPMLIYDQGQNQIWEPSFALPGYDGLVIDYIRPAYNHELHDDTEHRKQVYQDNQIPAVLITPMDMQGPDWQRDLYRKLQQTYRQPVDYLTYR